jgi:hypothetical protein
MTTDRLGKWHHGESNAIECMDGCDQLGDGLSDEEALKRAREHIATTGHFIEQSRTIFRYVNPIRSAS